MALWQVKHLAKVHWKHYTGSWLGDAVNFTNNIKITQHCFKTIHTKLIHTKLISSKTTHHNVKIHVQEFHTTPYSCCCNLESPWWLSHILQITSCRNIAKSPCLFILVWESTRGWWLSKMHGSFLFIYYPHVTVSMKSLSLSTVSQFVIGW